MSATRSYSEHERQGSMIDQSMANLQRQQPYKRKRETLEHARNKKQAGPRPSLSSDIHSNGHDDPNNSQDPFSNDSISPGYGSTIGQQLVDQIANATPSSAAAAIAANMPQLTVPRPTDLSFSNTVPSTDADRQLDSSFDMGGVSDGDQHHHAQSSTYNLDAYRSTPTTQSHLGRDSDGGHKPAVGTDEWHKVRKDNHKEVERRRRETINEGINELAKIVPNCEKNKGSILQRGVQYITQLKENEARNIEKWTLEKLLTDQAIADLSSRNEGLRKDLEEAYGKIERWKKACQDAGLEPKEEDSSITDDGEA